LEGQKLREAGKLTATRERFLACAADACPPMVRKDCAQWLEDTDRMFPTIVFSATDEAGRDLSAVHVTVDGAPLADRLDGRALRVEPGEHTFAFTTPERPPLSKKLVVREGVKGRQETIVLAAAAVAAPPSANGPPAAEAPPASGSSQRVLGLALGGAGIVGVAVGSAFGLMAQSSWKRAQAECNGPTPAQCPQHDQAVSDRHATLTSGAISTIAFAVGGAALATGVVLVLTAPGPTRAGAMNAVHVVAGAGSLRVVGAF
jgi:hypothetical protein